MRLPGRTLMTLIAGAGLAGGALAACATGTHVPPGAQQVRVTGTATAVLLDPPTVRAGDVYLVIEGSALFYQHAAAWQGDQSGPMSQEQLDRLAQNGDQSLTWSTVLYPGYAGNVHKYTLAAGMYAFIPVADSENPEAIVGGREGLCFHDPDACAALPPLPMTVLEVLP